MSLLGALLLDPAPFNVWITIRTDGLKGSGTICDPYDGSTQARFDAAMVTLCQQKLPSDANHPPRRKSSARSPN